MNQEVLKVVFQSCYAGFLCYLFLTVFILIDRTFKIHVLRKFFLASTAACILLVSDAFDYYFHLADIQHQLWPLFAAIGYANRVAIIGFVVTITNRDSLKFHKTTYILMIVNTILAFLSIKDGLYFSFDENHMWHFGPLFFVPYAISFFYAFLLMYSAACHFKSNVAESVMMIAFIFACVIANVLEILEIQRMVLSQVFVVCIIFYYLCMNVQIYRHDTLTSLLNRRCLQTDSRRMLRKRLILVVMDINNLKEINEHFGTSEGDRAIITCASMISDCFKQIASVYRIGDNEFAALLKNKTLEQATNSVSRLQKTMMKSKYRIAVGFTEFFPGNEFDRVLSVAEEKMLENKQHLKDAEKN